MMKRTILSAAVVAAFCSLLFSSGCGLAYRTHTFEYAPRPEGTAARTNFRIVPTGVGVDDEVLELIQDGLGEQNRRLPEVPVEVEIRSREVKDGFETSAVLWLLTAFVWPAVMDKDTLYDLSFGFPSETVTADERWTERDIMSWLMLPPAILTCPFGNPLEVRDNRNELVAEAFLSTLTEERYRASIAAMRRRAIEDVSAGRTVDADEILPLLDDNVSGEDLWNMVIGAAQSSIGQPLFRRLPATTDWVELAARAANQSIRESAFGRIPPNGDFAKLAAPGVPADVRLLAVERIDDETLLADLAERDAHAGVRLRAAEKTTSPARVARLAEHAPDDAVRLLALARIEDVNLLSDIAMKDGSDRVRKAAAQKITDPATAANLLKNAGDPAVRLIAVSRVTDDTRLLAAALEDESAAVRKAAAAAIRTDAVLAEVVASDKVDTGVRIDALRRIANAGLRKSVARASTLPAIRYSGFALPTDREGLEADVSALPPPPDGTDAMDRFYLGMDALDAALVAEATFSGDVSFVVGADRVSVMVDDRKVATAPLPEGKVDAFSFTVAQAERILDANGIPGLVECIEKRFGATRRNTTTQSFDGSVIRTQPNWSLQTDNGTRIRVCGQVEDADRLAEAIAFADAAVSAARERATTAREMMDKAESWANGVEFAILSGDDSAALAEARRLCRYYDDVAPIWNIRDGDARYRFSFQLGHAAKQDVKSAEESLRERTQLRARLDKPADKFSIPGLYLETSEM